MKKLISLIFITLLLGITMAFAASAANAPVVSLSNVNACPGQTVTVLVSIEGNAAPGFATAYYYFDYDHNALTLKSALAGVYEGDEMVEPYIMGMGSFVPNVEEDLITYVNYAGAKNNGVLMALTFEVAEDAANGSYSITVTSDSYMKNSSREYIDFAVIAGGITVGHIDNNKDHACDNGCGKFIGEHKDSPNDSDHICDYCLSDEVLEACVDGSDKNHDCDICGKKNIEGHTPGTKATCTTAQVCTECGAVLQKKLGHKAAIDAAVPATCTSTGLTEGSHCSVCNTVIVAQTVVPMTDHTFTNYVSNGDATCTKDGTETAVCDHCDATDTRTVQDSKSEHDYESAVTPPTCEKDGYTTYTCKNCNHSYVGDTVEAIGHNYDKNGKCACGATDPSNGSGSTRKCCWWCWLLLLLLIIVIIIVIIWVKRRRDASKAKR